MVFTAVCMFFPHDVSKIDAAAITKPDTEMFLPIYFEVRRSKVKVTSDKTLPAWVFALL